MSVLCCLLMVTSVCGAEGLSAPKGDGSAENPFQISNADELYWFASHVDSGYYSANAVLTQDIVVNENLAFDAKEVSVDSKGNLLDRDENIIGDSIYRKWKPICSQYYRDAMEYSSEKVFYQGTFDGKNHTISGLYVTAYDDYFLSYGFFSAIYQATIRNVGIINSVFVGQKHMSALCGVNNSGTIVNCFSSSVVRSSFKESYAGGVCEYNLHGTIDSCYHAGFVRGGENANGGVCAKNVGGIVKNCYNIGFVGGDEVIGGICGINYSGTIINCHNSGIVEEDASEMGGYIGGICGENNDTIAWCYNEGSVSGTGPIGGIVGGGDNDGVISNCYNIGSVYCNDYYYMGGILGEYFGKIVNCYNRGTLSCEECDKDEICPTMSKEKQIDSCFYLLIDGPSNKEGVGKTSEEFVDGSVAVLLRKGSKSETGSLWGQNLAKGDSVPNFSGRIVLKIDYENTDFASDTFDFSKGYTITKIPGKLGHTFEGWFDNPDFTGSPISVIEADSATGSVKLYPKFTVNRYLIQYLVDDELYHSDSIEFGASIDVAESPEKVGYTFRGWENVPQFMPDSDVVVTAILSANEHLLQAFVDGSVFESHPFLFGDSIKLGEPEKAGYTFSGWGEVPLLMPDSDVVVSGSFSPNRHSLIYVVENETYRIDTIAYDSSLISWQGPERWGCSFVEWQGLPERMPDEDVVVTAVYTIVYPIRTSHKGEETFFHINNVDDLYWFASFVNHRIGNTKINAILDADIVVNNLKFVGEDSIVTEGETYKEWVPIGNDSVPYMGVFDGNNHTLEGLYCDNRNADFVGLFGYVKDGTVKNVGVVNSYFHGEKGVGGVCGYVKNGALDSCYCSGVIDGESAGGVCYACEYGDITNCYNLSAVRGMIAGGVCVYAFGDVANCYNAGTVSGDYAAGVCAEYYGSDTSGTSIMTNCYNVGSVNGISYACGICLGTKQGTITNCYNIGQVSGQNIVSGFCGMNDGGAIDNCYFLSGTDDYAAQKVAEEFKDGTVVGLLNAGQKEPVWAQGANHPILLCNHLHEFDSDGFCFCDAYQKPALVDGVYQISNAGELYWFSDFVNKGGDNTLANAVLTDDIVVNILEFVGKDSIVTEGKNYREWDPIGREKRPYCGTFNGNHHTISGLYLGDKFNNPIVEGLTEGPVALLEEGADNKMLLVGLFGCVKDDSIKNVGVINSYFQNSNIAGGICAMCRNSVIDSCYNASRVVGNQYTGGICGLIEDNGTISNCYNTGSVSDEIAVGGVCGRCGFGRIVNCYNTSDIFVSGSEMFVGGVCGECGVVGSLQMCHNTGNIRVEGTYLTIGGVCGVLEGNLEYCYNMGAIQGNVESSLYAGGVCGYADLTSHFIQNCFNTGDMDVEGPSAYAYACGICGVTYGGEIVNCYNVGRINGNYAGDVYTHEEDMPDCEIINCYSLSDAESDNPMYKTAKQFADGTVAALLHEGENGSQWGQNLSAENSLPDFSGVIANQVSSFASNNASDNVEIWGYEGAIYVDNAHADIYVYDLFGRLVVRVAAAECGTVIPMDVKRIYIVKCGHVIKKIML